MEDSYFEGCNESLLQFVNPGACCLLDVGCAAGNLGARLKKSREIQVFGVEQAPAVAQKAAKKLDGVICGNIETLALPFPPETFDHVIFGDVLEHLKNPWAVLTRVKPLLKKDGSVIASIPNVGHISVLAGLIAGNWTYTTAGLLDKTHLRFFTLKEIQRLFAATGFRMGRICGLAPPPDSRETALIEAIRDICSRLNLPADQFPDQARIYQYVCEAFKL
ncbi:MAG: class I SAM-dependent methyltransferase [Heliobacteriaceae bacterium]|nr:class I SAM-dependent methyltransferase [Heliobacteriaceae bacterium]MDD4587588.1 class I SAM-dependent methyltransferase [Heliobacteriaceae bacterium]